MRTPEFGEQNPEHPEIKGDVEVPLKPEVLADKEVEMTQETEVAPETHSEDEAVENYIRHVRAKIALGPVSPRDLREYVNFLKEAEKDSLISVKTEIRQEIRAEIDRCEARILFLEKIDGPRPTTLIPVSPSMEEIDEPYAEPLIPLSQSKEKKESVWSKIKGKFSGMFSKGGVVENPSPGAFDENIVHKALLDSAGSESAELSPEEETRAQTNAVELLAPPDATPEVKRDMFALLKKEWARTAKTEIMGVALPSILVGAGTNMGASYAVRKALQASLGLGAGLALGAGTGGIMGFGKSYYAERKRTNEERDVALRNAIEIKITDALDREKLNSLKRTDRLKAYAEMVSGDVKKIKKELEAEAGIKINWKKVARSSLYGAVLGAAGSAVAGMIFHQLAGTIEVPHASAHVSVPEFSHPDIASTPDLSHNPMHLNNISSMPVHEAPAFHPHVDPVHVKVGGVPDITTHEPVISSPTAEHMGIDTHIAPLHEIGSLELSNQLGIPEGMYNSIDADHTSVQEMLNKISDAGASEDVVKPALALDSLKPTGDELGMTVKEFLKQRIMAGGGVVFKDL
ncbi:MAG: hypothetical protein JWL80_521 [Parcubacteria group bacterium]|nr:hypothetical protein [Parcubacteria group bacterium]